MKRTDKMIQKPSDTVSKSTCRILSTGGQSKERSEEIMNSVKMKLEVQNDKVKPMKKIAVKEQSKSEKVDGSKTSAHLSEALEKLSSVSAGFGNEEEKALLAKELKLETTFTEERKLLTAANTVEDGSGLLLSTGLTSTKIEAEKITENTNSTETSEGTRTISILREGESERHEIDKNIQSQSIRHDNLTDTFETRQELTINSESAERERSPLITLTASTIDSSTSPTITKLSSAVGRTFNPSNNNSELKDEYYRKSPDQIRDAETEMLDNSGSEYDKLQKIEEPILENLAQLQEVTFSMQSQDASSKHRIIYNDSYHPEAPMPQECMKGSERERRKSNDVAEDVSVL